MAELPFAECKAICPLYQAGILECGKTPKGARLFPCASEVFAPDARWRYSPEFEEPRYRKEAAKGMSPALAGGSCLYLCPACGFSELRRSAEKLAGCPVCFGHGLKAFGNASAPLGHLAGKEPKDFSGNCERASSKAETHIGNKAPQQGMARAIGANLGKRFNAARSKTRGDPAEYCLDALSASEAFERKACDESAARNVASPLRKRRAGVFDRSSPLGQAKDGGMQKKGWRRRLLMRIDCDSV